MSHKKVVLSYHVEACHDPDFVDRINVRKINVNLQVWNKGSLKGRERVKKNRKYFDSEPVQKGLL